LIKIKYVIWTSLKACSLGDQNLGEEFYNVSSTSREKQANSHLGMMDVKAFVRLRSAAIGALLVLFCVVAFSVIIQPNAVNIVVDGSFVGVAQSQQQVEETIEAIYEEKKEAKGLTASNISVIEFESVRIARNDIMAQEDIFNILKENLVFQYGAVGIAVNGEIKAVLESRQLAEKAIQEIKESYIPVNSNNREFNVLDVSIVEDLTFESVDVHLEEIMSLEEASEFLKFGEESVTYHEIVEGESLWTIARDHGMRVSELEVANADVNVNRLQIGQKIRLVKPEPAFSVRVTYERVSQETIPFAVQNVNNNSLMRGQSQIQEAGVNGAREVTYRITRENGTTLIADRINEVVISEPRTQVVAVGTRVAVASASRGATSNSVGSGGGSGQLAWPHRGTISSAFGQRGRGFHTGIDIIGRTGDPISAAEAGRVTFSGWRGGYGNLIIVDHGNGLSTYYAHLSQRLVSSGTQVGRGDLIGRLGSTGNSTGPHLHFEVRVNGQPQNPMRYLR